MQFPSTCQRPDFDLYQYQNVVIDGLTAEKEEDCILYYGAFSPSILSLNNTLYVRDHFLESIDQDAVFYIDGQALVCGSCLMRHRYIYSRIFSSLSLKQNNNDKCSDGAEDAAP